VTKMMLMALLIATPAMAQEKVRDLCTDRPGLGTAPCTVDAGHLQLEVGLADWQLDRTADRRSDSFTFGSAVARYGIGPSTELRLGWTAFGHERERDRMTGVVDRTSGVGDVTIGLKQNLAHPDGSGLSVALLPFATVPVGRMPIGKGDWGAGLIAPVEYEIADGFDLQLTPEIDAAVDEDGHGRHLAYSNVIGLAVGMSDAVTTTIELEAMGDRDPGGHHTMTLAAVSLAYRPKDQVQFDVGANAGLNRHTPDVELYLGVSRKF